MSEPLTEVATEPASERAPASPWMSPKDVAVYVRRHPNYIRLALQEYDRTKDSKNPQGLKGHQRKTGASWRVHREDVDRWLQGLPPARGTRRFR